MSTSKRTSLRTAVTVAALVFAGSQAGGCGPSFSSCEATRTCEPTGGRAEDGGVGGDTQGAGADNVGGVAGEASGFGGEMGDSDVGVGGNGASGSVSSGDAGTSGKAGGPNVATGGVGGREGESVDGGAGATGGAPTGPGSSGEAGAGASGQTECRAGYTILCGDLYGSTSCAKKRLYCLDDDSWPSEATGCVPSSRDCASPDDNDCDGWADNTIDETCTCPDLGVPAPGQEACLKYSPDRVLLETCCKCDGKMSTFTRSPRSTSSYVCNVN
jgi:hypothetical protein